MFYITGIIIAFFLGALLFTKKSNTFADKILACWLFVIGFHLFLFYLWISGRSYDYPALLGVHFPLPLLHGPFLYLYALSLTGRLERFKIKNAIHFLPALISYASLTRFYFLPADEKISVFQNKGAGYETYLAINIAAIIASGVLYVVLTALLHQKHRKKILQEFSNTEKVNLNWILYLMIGIALIWIFVILSMDDYVFGTAVLFVLFIGYFGIRQVGIFNPVQPILQASSTESELPGDPGAGAEKSNDESKVIEGNFKPADVPRKKYVKSGLSGKAADELHQQLTSLMDRESTFTESDLTLTELAKRLNVHPNHLSQVINEKEGKNFFDYINSLRTEEFKKLVSDPRNQKFTLLSLAFECGFNSKSSFNKYFKKATGISPSDYLKQIRSVEAA
jgi:AraC-like DNA-binding protein